MIDRTSPLIRSPRRSAGFTIVEVIVTFIIIGILATILVPVLVNRAGQARISATKAELLNIKEAQERAGIDTGFFYRLDVLDDAPGGDGIAATAGTFNPGVEDRVEGIQDNGVITDNLYDNPEKMFISTITQDFMGSPEVLFDRLIANETSFGWNGPYINYQQLRDANNNDWPDDPWGNDYLFFTRAGILYPPLAAGDTADHGAENFEDFGPQIAVVDESGNTIAVRFPVRPSTNAPLFDRPTILSMGPNGLPGDGTNATDNNYGDDDDVYYQFAGQFKDVNDTTP